MDFDEIIYELSETHKWLDDNYKNSNYYREYIDKVAEDLKEITTIL
jgi:hypothetical protein